MSDLIKQVGGIEKARNVVDRAPTQDCFYDTYEGLFYSKDHDHYWEWWDSDCKEWFECEFVVNQNEDGFIHLNDLRQAIADHDRTDTCVGIGKIDSLHPEFAKVLHDNFLDLITDNCSDIKNHLSPSTEVIER